MRHKNFEIDDLEIVSSGYYRCFVRYDDKDEWIKVEGDFETSRDDEHSFFINKLDIWPVNSQFKINDDDLESWIGELLDERLDMMDLEDDYQQGYADHLYDQMKEGC